MMMHFLRSGISLDLSLLLPSSNSFLLDSGSSMASAMSLCISMRLEAVRRTLSSMLVDSFAHLSLAFFIIPSSFLSSYSFSL